MHEAARKFTVFAKTIFPQYFRNKIVLDVGSGDINGNNRFLFDQCIYHGNDVTAAPNVTIVSRTKDLPFQDEYFDTIISTECFEHDPEYAESLKKIYSMLRPNGLFVFTCASLNRAEHGTRRTSVRDSYGTMSSQEDMQDYYKNLMIADINEVLPIGQLFSFADGYYNVITHDLYFYGIKRGANNDPSITMPGPLYNDVGTYRNIVINNGGDEKKPTESAEEPAESAEEPVESAEEPVESAEEPVEK